MAEELFGYYYLHENGSLIWASKMKVDGNGGEKEYFAPNGFVIDYIGVPVKRPAEGPRAFYEMLAKRFRARTLNPEETEKSLKRIYNAMITAERSAAEGRAAAELHATELQVATETGKLIQEGEKNE